jgi:hypothetical protein
MINEKESSDKKLSEKIILINEIDDIHKAFYNPNMPSVVKKNYVHGSNCKCVDCIATSYLSLTSDPISEIDSLSSHSLGLKDTTLLESVPIIGNSRSNPELRGVRDTCTRKDKRKHQDKVKVRNQAQKFTKEFKNQAASFQAPAKSPGDYKHDCKLNPESHPFSMDGPPDKTLVTISLPKAINFSAFNVCSENFYEVKVYRFVLICYHNWKAGSSHVKLNGYELGPYTRKMATMPWIKNYIGSLLIGNPEKYQERYHELWTMMAQCFLSGAIIYLSNARLLASSAAIAEDITDAIRTVDGQRKILWWERIFGFARLISGSYYDGTGKDAVTSSLNTFLSDKEFNNLLSSFKHSLSGFFELFVDVVNVIYERCIIPISYVYDCLQRLCKGVSTFAFRSYEWVNALFHGLIRIFRRPSVGACLFPSVPVISIFLEEVVRGFGGLELLCYLERFLNDDHKDNFIRTRFHRHLSGLNLPFCERIEEHKRFNNCMFNGIPYFDNDLVVIPNTTPEGFTPQTFNPLTFEVTKCPFPKNEDALKVLPTCTDKEKMLNCNPFVEAKTQYYYRSIFLNNDFVYFQSSEPLTRVAIQKRYTDIDAPLLPTSAVLSCLNAISAFPSFQIEIVDGEYETTVRPQTLTKLIRGRSLSTFGHVAPRDVTTVAGVKWDEKLKCSKIPRLVNEPGALAAFNTGPGVHAFTKAIKKFFGSPEDPTNDHFTFDYPNDQKLCVLYTGGESRESICKFLDKNGLSPDRTAMLSQGDDLLLTWDKSSIDSDQTAFDMHTTLEKTVLVCKLISKFDEDLANRILAVYKQNIVFKHKRKPIIKEKRHKAKASGYYDTSISATIISFFMVDKWLWNPGSSLEETMCEFGYKPKNHVYDFPSGFRGYFLKHYIFYYKGNHVMVPVFGLMNKVGMFASDPKILIKNKNYTILQKHVVMICSYMKGLNISGMNYIFDAFLQLGRNLAISYSIDFDALQEYFEPYRIGSHGDNVRIDDDFIDEFLLEQYQITKEDTTAFVDAITNVHSLPYFPRIETMRFLHVLAEKEY